MSGLYQRAIDYLRSSGKLRLVRPEESEDEFDGTAEERAEIERAIQQAVDENRIEVGPETFVVRPKKRGGVLPILVNVVALLVIGAGIYFLFDILGDQEQTVVTQTATIASAEGRLLTQLREQSEAELAEKQAEIAAIENRLAQVESEREQIRADAEVRLVSQETELRSEFEIALEAERERLSELGLSDDELTSRLAAFENEQQALLDSRLAAIQAEAAAELQAQEQALAALQDEFQNTLSAAEAERTALQSELAEREAELEAQFRAREEALSSEAAEAASLLEELQTAQEDRQLVLDQILSFYSQIRTSLAALEFTDARSQIQTLRSFLQTGPIAANPELQRRRQVELFLVDTIEESLDRAESAQSADTRSLVEAAGLIAEVGELISSAEGAFEAGSVSEARTLYVAALSEIPAVQIGYDRLVEIQDQLDAEESARVSSLIAQGNQLYVLGDFEAAASAYGEALASLPAPDDQLLGRVLDAGYQLLSEGDRAELAQLRDELDATQVDLERQTETNLTLADLADSQADELAGLRSRLDESQAAVAAARQEIQTAEANVAAANEAAAAAAANAADRTELDAALASLATTEELVSQLRGELEAAGTSIALLEADIAQQTQDAETALEAERAAGNAALDAERLSSAAALEAEQAATAAVQTELNEISSQVAILQSRLAEQRSIAERVDAYRASFGTGSSQSTAISSLELLETKLLILRIVGSDVVRADYPDLYDNLNAYLDALVVEQREDATAQTLVELDALLAQVATEARSSSFSIEELAADYPALALSAPETESVLTRVRTLSSTSD